MQFRFSLKVCLVCGLLIVAMLSASRWQWSKHLEKQVLIQTLKNTLHSPIVPLATLLTPSRDWNAEEWRRVSLQGTLDFEHEFIVHRNRGKEDRAGFHVVTPLKITGTDTYILLDRGFIPLGREARETRKQYQKSSEFTGFGLIKRSNKPKLFSPRDPPVGPGKPWADLWKRVHIPAIQKQLPYPILPIYVEHMQNPEDPLLAEQIVQQGSAGRNDILAMTGQASTQNFGMDSPDLPYPIPHFDTTPPPDIHLGYVFEWIFMALLTLGIGCLIQIRRH